MASCGESDIVLRDDSEGLEDSHKRNQDTFFVEEDSDVSSRPSVAKRVKRQLSLTGANGDTASSVALIPVNGKMPKYEAFKVEGRPTLAYYHDSFTKAEKGVSEVCDYISATVNDLRASYENHEVDYICDRNMSQIRDPSKIYPDVKPIAFLGPAGVGKSAALNCLLNYEAVAIESGSITRGTQLVHQYAACQPDQTSLYLVEVSYHAEEVICSHVKSHVEAVLAWLATSEGSHDLDAEELAELIQKKDTAVAFFVTTLCDHPEFEDKEEVTEFFREAVGRNTDEVVVDIYDRLADTLRKSEISSEGTECIPAHTDLELDSILHKISGPTKQSTEGEPRAPSLWPMIRHLTIHFDNDLLNTGVVLADTPGISDTNLDIINSSRRYLSRAGTILVYATYKRIAQSKELDEHLQDCIALGKMRSTYVVVTMIDEKATMKENEKRSLLSQDREELSNAEQRVEEIIREIDITKKAQDEAQEVATVKSLGKRVEALLLELAEARNMVKQTCIEIRNREIKAALKDKLRNLSGDDRAPDLPVFCVSHTEYQKHLAGYDVKDAPILSIEATGVPALRRMLYEVPAQGKYSVLNNVVFRRLPNILDGIVGVLAKPRLERKHEVEKLICKVLEFSEGIVDSMRQEFLSKFQERINGLIDNTEPQWVLKARQLLDEWTEYKAGTFAAFCRRSGQWKLPKKNEKINWNHKILSIFAKQLMTAFNHLAEDLDKLVRDKFTELKDVYKMLKFELRACGDFQGVDEKPFFKFINGVADRAIYEVAKLFNHELKESIAQIRYGATIARNDVVSNEDCLVAIHMQQTYEECLRVGSVVHSLPPVIIKVKGKTRYRSGAHPVRVATMCKKLTGNGEVSIFVDVGTQAKNLYEAAVGVWCNKCQDVINSCSDEIKRDFDRRFEVPEIKEEVNEEAVAKLQDAVQHARGMIEGQLIEHLLRAKAYEDAGKAA